MLPDGDGLDLLNTLRSRHIQTPVLVLTARDAVDDRIAGLDGGADDYLVKPFAFEEVLARVRALLRRPNVTEPIRLSVADLEMDLATRQVTRQGHPIDLTFREFELLNYLMRHEGRIVSRGMLAQRVWRDTARSTTLDNVIDVHMRASAGRSISRSDEIDTHGERRRVHTARGPFMMFRPRSLRATLTLWHMSALLVVLIAYAVAVFAFVRRNLSVCAR